MQTAALTVQTPRLPYRETLPLLIDKFLNSLDVRPSSRSTYRRSLKTYFDFLDKQGAELRYTDRETVLRYKQYLIDSKLSELTVGSYITTVRLFYEWTEANKLYPNVSKGVKNPKRSKGFKKNPITIGQIRELLEQVDMGSLTGKRDYAILNLLLRGGLRTIEIVRANIRDVGYKHGKLVIFVHGKGRDNKEDFVPLSDKKAYRPILDYLEARGEKDPDAPLFVSHSNNSQGQRLTTRTISKIVKDGLRGIGLDALSLTAHSLRHTAGVEYYRKTRDLYATQLFMRHSDPATTQIYLRTVEEEVRLNNYPGDILDEIF
jgi:integrase/recombinase XerD